MTDHSAGDRDIARLIKDLLSNERTPDEVSGMLTYFAARCTAIGLDFTAERFRGGAAPVAANDSFPEGNDAA
jgi:hypothetical protein